MGVDISLYLEIKRQEKWRRLSLVLPQPEPVGEQEDDYSAHFSCRYYHFEPFLEEAPSKVEGKLDVLSEDSRITLEGEGHGSFLGFGVFMFEDLNDYCESLEKKMLDSMSRAALCEINRRLDTIESLLKPGGDRTAATRKEYRDSDRPEFIEEVYYGFMERSDYVVLEFWRAVRSLPYVVPNLNPDELRVFYKIW